MSTTRPLLHHLALTVTDLENSIPWYEGVFAIRYQFDGPHEGGTGKLLADDDWHLVIVLHQHDRNQREKFEETRTGLDHVGFMVKSRSDLEAWQVRLEEAGVKRARAADRPLTQSPIADTPYGSILVFRDPDNIQLELCAPPGT
ncbi:MAG: VOC family protein [Actinomycetota bacterium]|nr:VOC family protein [Actinomycetota bacterium]